MCPDLYENLQKLTALHGISGDESAVREEIYRQIKDCCQCHVDNLGNLIAVKKGKKSGGKKILLTAHMDEVGLIVCGIHDDGSVYFSPVGGIDARVILGRQVCIGGKVPGVIGTKAIHLQSQEERETAVGADKLYIDIGAADKSQAQELVSPGDSITFEDGYTVFGDGMIRAKAIDDRFGCAALIQLLHTELPCDVTVAFVVQEEVGLRGAKTAAFGVDADIAIVLEATTACDLGGVPEDKQVCRLGDGPVVGFMDTRTIYDKELYRLAFETAKEKQIPIQTKTMVAGGNDAGAISVAGDGVKTIAVSVPCRYLHSPCCVMQQSDGVAALELVMAMLEKLGER